MPDEMRDARREAYREWLARAKGPGGDDVTSAYWAGFEAGWDRARARAEARIAELEEELAHYWPGPHITTVDEDGNITQGG
jgi:hypothetical protein